jgi:hypothetical protein
VALTTPDKKSVTAKPVRKNGGRTNKRDPATFIGLPPGFFACGNMQCAAIAGDLRLFCYKHKNWMRQSLVTPKNNQGLWSPLKLQPQRFSQTPIANAVEVDSRSGLFLYLVQFQ